MRPEKDVLARLRWDPAYDQDLVLVGWEDRWIGIVETPLAEWCPNGGDWDEPPLHRIRYFKYDGVVIWDRVNRIDLLFHSAGYKGKHPPKKAT